MLELARKRTVDNLPERAAENRFRAKLSQARKLTSSTQVIAFTILNEEVA